MQIRSNCTVAILTAALAIPGWSQVSGGFEGTVYDPAGAVIADASVRVIEVSTERERTAVSNGQGWYQVAGLPPGAYRFEVNHPSFSARRREGVGLAAGRNVRIDFHLEIGAASESVNVAAPAPLVDVSSSDWCGAIGKQELEDLPLNGRDMFDLAAQEPGARAPVVSWKRMTTGSGIQLSVNGARPNQNAFRTDGVYVNDAAGAAPTSAAGRMLGIEGVQELRLVTAPYSAEYGRAAGAVLTAVSRSGGSDFHGSAFWFLRDSALDAKNYFDQPDQDIPPLRRHQFGGSFGGPIRRSKTYFFLNYEGIREKEGETLHPITLTEAARQGRFPDGSQVPVSPIIKPYLDLYPLPTGRDFGDGTAEYVVQSLADTNEDYIAGKVDHYFSDRLRLSGRYTADVANVSRDDAFAIWTFADTSRYDFLHTDLQFIQSADSLHNIRFGYSRIRNTKGFRQSDGVPRELSFVSGQTLGSLRASGLSDIGGLEVQLRPREQLTNNYQLSYMETLVRGAHTLTFGGGYDYVRLNHISENSATGVYVFGSVTDLLLAQPERGDVLDPKSTAKRIWRQHNLSGFVQDQFRPVRRLDITLGVRYETYTTPSEAEDRIATLRDPYNDTELTIGPPLFDNPSRANFAPRAALA